jgi:hypothetical protein
LLPSEKLTAGAAAVLVLAVLVLVVLVVRAAMVALTFLMPSRIETIFDGLPLYECR